MENLQKLYEILPKARVEARELAEKFVQACPIPEVKEKYERCLYGSVDIQDAFGKEFWIEVTEASHYYDPESFQLPDSIIRGHISIEDYWDAEQLNYYREKGKQSRDHEEYERAKMLRLEKEYLALKEKYHG